MKYSIWKNFWVYKIAWISFGFAFALMLFEEWFFRIDFYQFLIFVFTQIENANETFLRVGIQILIAFLWFNFWAGRIWMGRI